MVVVDQKFEEQKSEDEPGAVRRDGVVETEVGPVDDGTAETEVDFRPPRGSNRVPEDRPIITFHNTLYKSK